VPANANAATIQSIINRAAKAAGTRPVVHFPYGNYNISTTLLIPAHTDMQLVGDGFGEQYATMLTWSGTTPGPVIAIAGPSKVTMRDLTIKGNATNTNILITNADQKGARIFLQEFHQMGGQLGLLVNQLDHTLVFGQDNGFAGIKKAISVVGGPLAAQGKPAEGRTIMYSGAESNNTLSHEMTNGGNLMVQDSWYEGGIKSTWVKLTGKGIFTADGNHISTPLHTSAPSVIINNFSGRATFIANDFTDRFAISGSGAHAKILALGIMAENDSIIADTSKPKADLRLFMSRARNNSMTWLKGGSSALPDVGMYEPRFVNSMLSDMAKIRPLVLISLPVDVTDIRLYRVMSLNGAKGLDIEAGGIDNRQLSIK
jgi:hypothetical protein